ncbi:MAG: phosphoenolpyruvate mutase [Verrucomicrobia bacterium]|nr:phosphoenolpyruvate mutase [Verrucomicrobiota bacterium]
MNPSKETTVYVSMSADFLHAGHVNLIAHAAKLGRVVVGLMTDAAIQTYKKPSFLDYQKRYEVVKMIRDVDEVIPQKTLDYTENLLKLKPDYVVHGDDWKKGGLVETRKKVLEVLSLWGGQLIELPYTESISSTKIKREIFERNMTPYFRLKSLKELLRMGFPLRAMEAHNALSASIVDAAHTHREDGTRKSFDALWFSSLTDSASRGKADVEIVDLTSKLLTIREMLNVTSKPIIIDLDTGGTIPQFVESVKSLESIGVSAICIEDKTGPKLNSLYGNSVAHFQDTVENFCEKIALGKRAQISEDFVLIARVESLVLGKGIEDALKRALAYVEAGADMILIHSVSSKFEEVDQFCQLFREKKRTPLVAIPTKYNSTYEAQMFASGVDMVIYANHLLRSAYLAMQETAKTILQFDRSLEAEQGCISVDQLLKFGESVLERIR